MENKSLKNESRISLRASKTELDKWKSEAEQAGFKSFISYLRNILNNVKNEDNLNICEARLIELAKIKELNFELSRIGNNLNQIARKLNSGDGVGNIKSSLNECDIAVLESLILIRKLKVL